MTQEESNSISVSFSSDTDDESGNQDASRVLRVDAVVEVSDNVIDSLPNPEIPDEAYAVFIAAIPPVSDVSALASTAPVVFESKAARKC